MPKQRALRACSSPTAAAPETLGPPPQMQVGSSDLFTKRTTWPPQYRVQIRARKRRGQLGETKSWMSFWLPRELLRALHHFGSAEVIADRRGLDQ
eukprot:3020789-Pyramimonas_sp.AAC.1